MLAVPVRATPSQPTPGTKIAIVGKVCTVVRRLSKVPTSVGGDNKERKGHTSTMTRETVVHHAVEYRARSNEALVH